MSQQAQNPIAPTVALSNIQEANEHRTHNPSTLPTNPRCDVYYDKVRNKNIIVTEREKQQLEMRDLEAKMHSQCNIA